MDWFWLVVNVALVNIILSGDNALAISMAAGRLPAEMRKKAIVIGSTIAILLLILFTSLGTFIIRLPVFKGIAGLLLLWIAIKIALEHMKSGNEEAAAVETPPDQLWKAIGAIILADLGMELDNAMAMLGAANGRLSVLIVGFLFTIPFLIFGSRVISTVFNKIPWIIYFAATYIAYIAGKMISDDPIFEHVTWSSLLHWLVPALCVAVFLVIEGMVALRLRNLDDHRGQEASVKA
ncbi:YjbE family putative metal transport protein [Alicyclobacillus herbarius]|uniref:YjbE family putative metal transport protein n=1 Tax=Alicyclobacillus herbarius TaxID=122960 RepID=UPI000404B2DE|nr:YjbE family putative metal transport protein [Alicyclobacillus herbarius]